MNLPSILLLISALLVPISAVFADSPQDNADAAVAHVLFDYEEPGFEFASWRVNGRGEVNILFASNMPDALYGEILTKLQKHPDIPSVLSSKGGPACALW